jgi:hypothetical protein
MNNAMNIEYKQYHTEFVKIDSKQLAVVSQQIQGNS